MNNMLKSGEKLISEKGIKYTVCKMVGSYGQGEVYDVECGEGKYTLKWYYKSSREIRYIAKYTSMIEEGSPGSAFQWPCDIIYDKDTFGIICNHIPFRNGSFVDLVKGKYSFPYDKILRICEELAYNMQLLHAKGYILSAEYDFSFDPNSCDIVITVWEKIKKEGDDISPIGAAKFMAPEVIMGKSEGDIYSDLYVLSIFLFYILVKSHPMDGKKEFEIKCFDLQAMEKLYGSDPIFIYDPDDPFNRPVKGYHDNAIWLWRLYPAYIKGLFIRCFTKGIKRVKERPVEREWIDAFRRLRSEIVKCTSCGVEFFSEGKEKRCWNCGKLVRLNDCNENILAQIQDISPEAIRDKKRFKAYLLDLIPDDRRLRNILCLSIDLGIPDEIDGHSYVDKKMFYRLTMRLIKEYAVDEAIAIHVVSLWADCMTHSKYLEYEANGFSSNTSDISLFEYKVNGDDVIITKYKGTEDKIVIPEMISEKNVTAIGNGVFDGNDDLSEKRVEVVLPQTIKRIERGAFCSSVSSINLPEGLVFIGQEAFEGVPIQYLYIPSSVETIEEMAFFECASLFIDVDKNNTKYVSENGALYDKKMETLLFYPYHQEYITFPKSVRRLGDALFAHLMIDDTEEIMRKYVIPSHIREIGACCFQGQGWNIVIQNRLEKIGELALAGCVLSANIDELLTWQKKIERGEFFEVKFDPEIMELHIPDNVSMIGDNAFDGTTIAKITIPGSVRIVYQGCFNCMDMLKTIVFEDGVEEIKYSEEDKLFRRKLFYDMDIYLPESINVIEPEFKCCRIHCVQDGKVMRFFKEESKEPFGNEFIYLE